ncbi:hypothetical protein [Ramlibacter alkalitolerans]|uniref:Uncharacterized protein n=1 Tax=Ramlibacter alkalitolerans TaxID=2039631 RepID=A0ABS1JUQ0_9BURK|nr:hypothetical protein [Ramlibacter alkalitolerans]MBL0427937.1 hypothetical protein [Ramlibacter alkalitolerans]
MTTRIARQRARLASRVAQLGAHKGLIVDLACISDRRLSDELQRMQAQRHAAAELFAHYVREARAWRWGSGPALPCPRRRQRQMPRR